MGSVISLASFDFNGELLTRAKLPRVGPLLVDHHRVFLAVIVNCEAAVDLAHFPCLPFSCSNQWEAEQAFARLSSVKKWGIDNQRRRCEPLTRLRREAFTRSPARERRRQRLQPRASRR